MKKLSILLPFALVASLGFVSTGCSDREVGEGEIMEREESEFEEVGDNIEHEMEDVGDEVEEVTD